MPNSLPLVAAAFACEKVLREGDVISAIRIVDTYIQKLVRLKPLPGEAPAVTAPSVSGMVLNDNQVLDITALVMVRAGDVQGKHQMTVEMVSPIEKSVKYPQPFNVDFAMNDPAETATLNIKFVLAGDAPAGRYWINVFWDGEPLTRIPIKLVKQSESQVPQSGAEQSQ